MATCQPRDYVCRFQNGEFFGSAFGLNGSSTSINAPASVWWKIGIGVAVLAVLIDVEPRLGGWLLLLIVLGLALTRGRAIIEGT